MDNSKSYLPRFLEKTKENQGTERLPSKISGCIVYSGFYELKRKTLFFINHDQVSSILFHMICLTKIIYILKLKTNIFIWIKILILESLRMAVTWLLLLFTIFLKILWKTMGNFPKNYIWTSTTAGAKTKNDMFWPF